MRSCRKCPYYEKKDLRGFSLIRKIQSVSGFCHDHSNEDFNCFAQVYGRGICRIDSFTSPKWCRLRDKKEEYNIPNNYCPICAEFIGNEPFCSSCGEVAGSEPEEYKLHTRDYYINKQISMFGKVIVEPVHFLPLDN